MLKVVHINVGSQVEDQGGMARLLHDYLLADGVESTLFAYRSETEENKGIFSLRDGENEWSHKLMQTGQERHLPELYSPQLLQLLQHKAFEEADVVHLHATGPYFSYLLLPFLSAKPLVWTLYDCRPYTGGCFHSEHCRQWQQEECSACPIDQRQHTEGKHKELSQLKSNIYKTIDIHVVCTSSWQQKQVANSLLKGQAIQNIALAVDTRTFHPGDKLWFRRELNLPEEKFLCVYYCPQDAQESGVHPLRQAMEIVAKQYKDVVLISLGKDTSSYLKGLDVEIRHETKSLDSQTLAAYFRAGDVLLQPHLLEQTAVTVLKAAACGMPAIAFALGAASEVIEHQKTGYVAQAANGEALAEGLLWFLEQPARIQEAGLAAAKCVWETNRLSKVSKEYTELYQSLLPKRLQSLPEGPEGYIRVIRQAETSAAGLKKFSSDWEKIWQELDMELEQFKDQDKYKGTYIDAFFKKCLEYVDIEQDKGQIWKFVHQWLVRRKPEPRCGHFLAEEKNLQAQLCFDLRQRLVQYFLSTSLEEIGHLEPACHDTMTRLWRWIFLNALSCLNLVEITSKVDEQVLATEQGQSGYPKLLLQSMFIPHPATDGNLLLVRLLQSRLPLSMKIIVLLWLTNAPLYSGTSQQREVVLKSIESFCRYAADHLADKLPEGFINICMEQFTSSLWRISYVGGNNCKALSAYGDFIRATMLHKFASYEQQKKKRKKNQNRAKIRIGYLSTNFRNQAVSFYMANRILLHDPEKFEIYTYVLNRYEDELTEQIRKASDKVFEYKEFTNLEPIIKDISTSDLDILIYADIGMDPFTYELGSLRLASKQAVLVGHGVTTGLKEIDYYISGDFEPEDAQNHYREKLIRLPNLGAAQLPPKVNQHGMTRQAIGVPEEAVLLMSCANGIKHHPDRDQLLIDILKQAPEAWIVLKPFQNPNSIDGHLNERIMNRAKDQGVAERLIILPPLGNPADLWGLLTLADIQLDTYPYGGWTTNMEALYAGLPIVTQEGNMARNRWGAGMLRALGIQEGIAKNETEYVEWAVRLVKSKDLRVNVARRIQDNVKNVLFNGSRAQIDYENVICDIEKINSKNKYNHI